MNKAISVLRKVLAQQKILISDFYIDDIIKIIFSDNPGQEIIDLNIKDPNTLVAIDYVLEKIDFYKSKLLKNNNDKNMPDVIKKIMNTNPKAVETIFGKFDEQKWGQLVRNFYRIFSDIGIFFLEYQMLVSNTNLTGLLGDFENKRYIVEYFLEHIVHLFEQPEIIHSHHSIANIDSILSASKLFDGVKIPQLTEEQRQEIIVAVQEYDMLDIYEEVFNDNGSLNFHTNLLFEPTQSIHSAIIELKEIAQFISKMEILRPENLSEKNNALFKAICESTSDLFKDRIRILEFKLLFKNDNIIGFKNPLI